MLVGTLVTLTDGEQRGSTATGYNAADKNDEINQV